MSLFFLFHILFATALGWGLSALFGALTPWIAGVSLLFGALLARRPTRLFLQDHADWRFRALDNGNRGMVEMVLAVFILYVAARHYMWLLFPYEHHYSTLLIFNFGDLPLHINYIRQMASGAHFPPVDPSYASDPLLYPFGIDLYSALWEAIGVPLRAHLFVVGMLGTAVSLVFLRSFAGWFGILAFFLSGGMLGWGVLAGEPLLNIGNGVEWKNLFLAVFITQRGFLFALPAGLFLLTAFRRHVTGAKPLTGVRAWTFGLVWGLFPLFHLHVFVVVSLMLAGIAFENGNFTGLNKLINSTMMRVAFLPALFITLRSTSWFQKASIAHFHAGWTCDVNPVSCFGFNFGPWLLLPLFILIALIMNRPKLSAERRRRISIEFTVTSGLFILFCFLMLAPWDWDNIKLLIWPYLGFVRIAYLLFDSKLNSYTRPAAAFVFGLSGFMVLAWSIQSPNVRQTKLYEMSELANTQGSLAQIPVDAVFAAAPTHDHPLTYFGRIRAVGYAGHLWSHGIQSAQSEALLKNLMDGDNNWYEAAKKLGVQYIYWGPKERELYGIKARPWPILLKNVSRVKDYEVYLVPPSRPELPSENHPDTKSDTKPESKPEEKP